MADLDKQRELIVAYWIRTVLNMPLIDDIMRMINDYGVEWDRFDKNVSHSLLIFDNDCVTLTRHDKDTILGWVRGYGTVIAVSGNCYQWKVKIIETRNKIMIGIINNMELERDSPDIWFYQEQDVAITYRDDGSVYHKEKVIQFDKFYAGDIIGVHLDFRRNLISFSKNGTKFDEIDEFVKQDTKYRLVVSFYEDSDQQTVQLIDFKQQYGK